MKRLTVFVCGLLMLASCQDIEDARTLPKEFSIGDVTDVSELTYDELENLVINEYYYDPVSRKEEMRRDGGLLIKGVVATGSGESYNDAYLWFSTEESNLSDDNLNAWNAGHLPCLTTNMNNPLFFQSNQDLENYESGVTYYYKLGLYSWDREFPGFVDDCLSYDYSPMVFSSVKKYTRPEVPYLFNCTVDGADAIAVNSQVKSKYPVSEGGICYSMTNQLPSKKDEVVYCKLDNNHDKYDLSMSAVAFPRENGAYYVRAFAVSEKGTSYSPVQKVTIY